MSTAAPPQDDLDALRERLREDTPFWAKNFAKIVTKQGELIPLKPKAGQLELDRRLEGQRAAGKPMRAYALKARQVGISTWAQAKLLQRCTLHPRYNAVSIAHDRETGSKLYLMAETMYVNLPEDPDLKPRLGQWRKGRGMHFAGDGLWSAGELFPDSRYLVDTAGEFEAGRGGTYRGVHLSEMAFWPQIMQKYTGVVQAIADDPESLLVGESTANGYNAFKDLWDDAEEGRSDFIAFFWPWFREEEYRLGFASETERESFVVGDPSHPYAEREPELVQRFELDQEQLNWRRRTIANKCGGDLRIFDQEYPTVPEDAFISTGGKVFDSYRTAQLLVRVELTDPRVPSEECPGPLIGDLKVAERRTDPSRSGGTIEVPTRALWTPRQKGMVDPSAPWRLWIPDARPTSEYIVSADVSGGKTETTDEPDYHAIVVIDHKTREQVAEYRSRIDVDLLTEQVLLAALFFNQAYVVVERTGSWGQPVLRILWLDFHYPHVYRSKKVGNASEKTEHRLGWDTNVRTKPLLVAGMAELLRIEEDGIKSRLLAGEVRTYTRTEKGTTEAEPGKYDDLLMAHMIAQHVARELPLKGSVLGGPGRPAPPRFDGGGLGSYDSRYP